MACQDGMVQRKPGTARGSPRRSRTAKASRISRRAVKSRCACERGGWGRLSDDGPGHHNPDRSEDPWGGGDSTSWRCTIEPTGPTQCGISVWTTRCTKGGCKPDNRSAHAGSRLKLSVDVGKAPPDKPAFQPYWGKPAVRNDRGDRGNVGIIRSPVRASILPDRTASAPSHAQMPARASAKRRQGSA